MSNVTDAMDAEVESLQRYCECFARITESNEVVTIEKVYRGIGGRSEIIRAKVLGEGVVKYVDWNQLTVLG